MSANAGCYETLLKDIKEVVEAPGSRDEKLTAICGLLLNAVDRHHWVGFYLVDRTGDHLVLGPYLGQPTQHVRIPFGQGLCGLAAEKRRTLMVPDVSRVLNYLSCSPLVKSEIIVPIFRENELVAELDIDSHDLDAFAQQDKNFLEEVGRLVARLF
jgi:GAF domain-containing protein